MDTNQIFARSAALSLKTLSSAEMEKIEGGSCPSQQANAAVTGFCIVGSFFNPFVAAGCAVYGGAIAVYC